MGVVKLALESLPFYGRVLAPEFKTLKPQVFPRADVDNVAK